MCLQLHFSGILQTNETRQRFDSEFTNLNPVCAWYEEGTKRSLRASDAFRQTLPDDIENDNQTLSALEKVSYAWHVPFHSTVDVIDLHLHIRSDYFGRLYLIPCPSFCEIDLSIHNGLLLRDSLSQSVQRQWKLRDSSRRRFIVFNRTAIICAACRTK